MVDVPDIHLSGEFTASLVAVDRCCCELRAALSNAGLGGAGFNLELIAREALNNAVIHGCRGRSEGTVQYDLTIRCDAMVLEVIDDGPGFDWQRRLQACAEVSELASSGRGLGLLVRLCSSVVFNSKGNGVRVCRQLTG